MSTRAELALVVLYLNKAEAWDKICRAIQYGSKFLSNGQPGTAQNVDKSTNLARKVFHLFKFVNYLHSLISQVPQGTPLLVVLLGKFLSEMLARITEILSFNRTRNVMSFSFLLSTAGVGCKLWDDPPAYV
ncbi:hypothetical protein QYF36_009512 [Acer negundo]|nr:hypothetical protein QYF36_009512 [Acer negundo]